MVFIVITIASWNIMIKFWASIAHPYLYESRDGAQRPAAVVTTAQVLMLLAEQDGGVARPLTPIHLHLHQEVSIPGTVLHQVDQQPQTLKRTGNAKVDRYSRSYSTGRLISLGFSCRLGCRAMRTSTLTSNLCSWGRYWGTLRTQFRAVAIKSSCSPVFVLPHSAFTHTHTQKQKHESTGLQLLILRFKHLGRAFPEPHRCRASGWAGLQWWPSCSSPLLSPPCRRLTSPPCCTAGSSARTSSEPWDRRFNA